MYNKFVIVGNLTRDVEMKSTPNGTTVATVDVAVSRRPDKDGNSGSDFFSLSAFGKTAELCGKYLKKGKKILAECTVQNHNYEDKDGIKRYSFNFLMTNVEFLSPLNSNSDNDGDAEQSKAKAKNSRPTLEEVDDDNLPF